MFNIEPKITPIIRSQFPSLYQSEGPVFIKFVKAYYEWLETHHQLLVLDDSNGFDVGNTVSQNGLTGTIISKQDNTITVRVDQFQRFVCTRRCDFLTPIVSSSGASTDIRSSPSLSPIFFSRALPRIADVDTTMDAFIRQFKEKYLANINFNVASNKQLMIKKALDLFRSKGTPRAVDLFFRLLYGTTAEVSYPGQRVFRLSDNEWIRPQYLEVTSSPNLVDLIGKQITGSVTGATAFVEKLIKRRVSSTTINVLYISNVVGQFIANEAIITTQVLPDPPLVLGSLNRVTVLAGGRFFSPGDIVSAISTQGAGGQLRVVSVSNQTGVVDFELINGGWGYDANSEVIVSERTLTLNAVSVPLTTSVSFKPFEALVQPRANVVFDSNTGPIVVGQTLAVSNGTSNVAEALVVDSDTNEISISLNKGFVNNISNGHTLILTTNTSVTANIASLDDTSIFSTVVGSSNSATIVANSIVGFFSLGDTITQTVPGQGQTASAVVDELQVIGSTVRLQAVNMQGIFRPSYQITSTNGSSTVSDVTVKVGVYDMSGSFDADSPFVRTANTGTLGTIERISTGAGASFSVGLIGEPEIVFLNTDAISGTGSNTVSNTGTSVNAIPYLDLNLDLFAFGFPKAPQANLSSILFNTLTYDTFTLGSIESLTAISPGSEYNDNPFVQVIQRPIAGLGRNDFIISVANVQGVFVPGERIFQTAANIVFTSVEVSPNTSSFIVGETVYQGANVWISDVSSIANNSHIIVRNASGVINVSSSEINSFLGPTVSISYDNATSNISASDALVVLNNVPEAVGQVRVIESQPSNATSGSLYVQIVSGTLSNADTLQSISDPSVTATATTVTNITLAAESASDFSFEATAKAIVNPGSTSDVILAKRITVEQSFTTGQLITGQLSGAQAMVVDIAPDLSKRPIGLNADVNASVITANGSVRTVEVIDSGFGYRDGDLQLVSSDGTRSFTGRAEVTSFGTGDGYFRSSKGFLSSEVSLHDSNFFQEYSYEIISQLPLDKYAEVFRSVIHMAGTRFFGTVAITPTVNTNIVISESEVDVQ